MAVATITPSLLDSDELADYLAEQIAPLRDDTTVGAQLVHNDVNKIVKALRAGDIAPVVAQVRLLRVNRCAAHHGLKRIDAYEVV